MNWVLERSPVRVRTPDGAGAGDPTRARVARSILENGASTAAALGQRLGLTPAAVRRHLDALVADGHVAARDPYLHGPRGRGRPAKVFALTAAGRDEFEQAYDVLAVEALEFLVETGGVQALEAFAQRRLAGLPARYETALASGRHGASDGLEGRARAMAEALTADGYAATAAANPRGGEQICQHHCPVAHAAERFPQLCEAETELMARLLGTHVQRLATIARGDGICTTYVPPERTAR